MFATMFRFRRIVAVAVALACACMAAAQAAPRAVTALDEGWEFAKGAPVGWTAVTLPHTFNADDGTAPHPYRGAGWYRRTIVAPAAKAGRTYLEFDGAALSADVWLNGTRVGRHEGGFARFRFDVTDLLRAGANELRVRVARQLPRRPHQLLRRVGNAVDREEREAEEEAQVGIVRVQRGCPLQRVHSVLRLPSQQMRHAQLPRDARVVRLEPPRRLQLRERDVEDPLPRQVRPVRQPGVRQIRRGHRGEAQEPLRLRIVVPGQRPPERDQHLGVLGLRGERTAEVVVRALARLHLRRDHPEHAQQHRVLGVILLERGEQLERLLPPALLRQPRRSLQLIVQRPFGLRLVSLEIRQIRRSRSCVVLTAPPGATARCRASGCRG